MSPHPPTILQPSDAGFKWAVFSLVGRKQNRGGFYSVSYFDHTGQRRRHCNRTTDKAAADRIAAKLEAAKCGICPAR